MKKYLRLVEAIEDQIVSGALSTGDKLPSLRRMNKAHNVSIATILKAMDYLSGKGYIQSEEKKGYFITYDHAYFDHHDLVSEPSAPEDFENFEQVLKKVFLHYDLNCKVDFSVAVPSKDLLPVNRLKKAVIETMHQSSDAKSMYQPIFGNEELRKLIAQRSVISGTNLNLDEIVTTNGGTSAIGYALKVCSKPGDIIVTESPLCFGILQLAKTMDMKVREVRTSANTGIVLDDLEQVLRSGGVSAIVTVTNFGNPLGYYMPDNKKKALVDMARKYKVTLIEDDPFGDLYYASKHPSTCKQYDETGEVIYCSTFSKTLVPGFRVGYVAGGKYTEAIAKTQLYHTISANSLTHSVVAKFLETGSYDRYLNQLRKILQSNLAKFSEAIKKYFPAGTKLVKPRGGSCLWIQLDECINTLALFEICEEKGVRFVPGRLFSLGNQYNNCLKIAFAVKWSQEVERGLRTIGEEAQKLLKTSNM